MTLASYLEGSLFKSHTRN